MKERCAVCCAVDGVNYTNAYCMCQYEFAYFSKKIQQHADRAGVLRCDNTTGDGKAVGRVGRRGGQGRKKARAWRAGITLLVSLSIFHAERMEGLGWFR